MHKIIGVIVLCVLCGCTNKPRSAKLASGKMLGDLKYYSYKFLKSEIDKKYKENGIDYQIDLQTIPKGGYIDYSYHESSTSLFKFGYKEIATILIEFKNGKTELCNNIIPFDDDFGNIKIEDEGRRFNCILQKKVESDFIVKVNDYNGNIVSVYNVNYDQ